MCHGKNRGHNLKEMEDKKMTRIAVSTVVLSILCVAPLNSQTQKVQSQNSFKANVPFQFVLGNRTLPAGTYSVQMLLHNRPGEAPIEVVSLRTDGFYQTLIANLDRGQESKDGIHFAFKRYGEQVFLAEISTGNSRLTFPPPAREKELASRMNDERIDVSVGAEVESLALSAKPATESH
jgi:hypothetical protein